MKISQIVNLFTIVPKDSLAAVSVSTAQLDSIINGADSSKALKEKARQVQLSNLVAPDEDVIVVIAGESTYLFNKNSVALTSSSYSGFIAVDLVGGVLSFGIVRNSFTFVVNFEADIDDQYRTDKCFENGDPMRFKLSQLRSVLSQRLFSGLELPQGVTVERTQEILAQINAGCLDDGDNFFIACQY